MKRGNARAFTFECQSFVLNLKLGIHLYRFFIKRRLGLWLSVGVVEI